MTSAPRSVVWANRMRRVLLAMDIYFSRWDMSCRVTRFAICIGCLVTLGLRCVGFLPAPEPTQVYFSADRTKILVLVSVLSPDEDENRLLTNSPNTPVIDLRATTRNSGLYSFPDLKVIHPLPFSSEFSYEIFPASDLSCFAVVNRYGASKFSTWGLRFYRGGVLVKSYAVTDLCSLPHLLPAETCGWDDRWTREVEIKEGNKLWLSTAERPLFRGQVTIPSFDGYLFELSTGAVIEHSNRTRWLLLLLTFVAGVLVIIARRVAPQTK